MASLDRSMRYAVVLASLALGALEITALQGCADSIGSASATVANECAAPSGAPIEHAGFLASDETWGPGLHHVRSNVEVRTGVTLTIAPCAVVRLDENASITVNADAKALHAHGTPTNPIVVEREDAGKAWGNLAVYAPASLDLAYVTLRGGGTTSTPANADFVGATLVSRNQQGAPHDVLAVDHVTVENSNGLGVFLDSTGFAAGSTDLTVTGAGSYPVYLGAAFATNLPKGVYAPNGKAAFLLQSCGPAAYLSDNPVLQDATIPERGLPFLVGENADTSIDVGDGRTEHGAATLTIEPGVELRFGGPNTTAKIRVRAHNVGGISTPQGTLVARGTAEKPIVFTSQNKTPAAGDWMGIYVESGITSSAAIDHAVVEFAGGESTSTGTCVSTVGASNYDADCSVVLWFDAAPPRSFITNTTIRNGKGCGVYRAWKGADVDFTATNTFTALTGCTQSNVQSTSGACDTAGACR